MSLILTIAAAWIVGLVALVYAIRRQAPQVSSQTFTSTYYHEEETEIYRWEDDGGPCLND